MWAISTFGRNIHNDKITAEEADEDQRDLLVEVLNFKKKVKPKIPEKKQQKEDVLNNLYTFFS